MGGKVFVLPHGRGLAPAAAYYWRPSGQACAPAAIITRQVDPILALGAIVAEHLYGRGVPAMGLTAADFASIEKGDLVAIEVDGGCASASCGSA